MSKYVVLGAGSWGTTVAKVIADGAHEVTLWARKPELAQEIAKTGENSHYLPGIELPKSITATSDLEFALKDSEQI